MRLRISLPSVCARSRRKDGLRRMMMLTPTANWREPPQRTRSLRIRFRGSTARSRYSGLGRESGGSLDRYIAIASGPVRFSLQNSRDIFGVQNHDLHRIHRSAKGKPMTIETILQRIVGEMDSCSAGRCDSHAVRFSREECEAAKRWLDALKGNCICPACQGVTISPPILAWPLGASS